MNKGITQDAFDRRSIKLAVISPIELRSRYYLEYDTDNIYLMSAEVRLDDEEMLLVRPTTKDYNQQLLLDFTCLNKGITTVTVMLVIADKNFVYELDRQFSFVKYCGHVPIYSLRMGYHKVMSGKQASAEIILNGQQQEEFSNSLNRIGEDEILDTYFASYNPNYNKYATIFSSSLSQMKSSTRFSFLQILKISNIYFEVEDLNVSEPFLLLNGNFIETKYYDYTHKFKYSFKEVQMNPQQNQTQQLVNTSSVRLQKFNQTQTLDKNAYFELEPTQYQMNFTRDFQFMNKIYKQLGSSFIEIDYEQEILSLETDTNRIDQVRNIKKLREIFHGLNENHKEDEPELVRIQKALIVQLDQLLQNSNFEQEDEAEISKSKIEDGEKTQAEKDKEEKLEQAKNEIQDDKYLDKLINLFLKGKKEDWPKQVSIKAFKEIIKKVQKIDGEIKRYEKLIQKNNIEQSRYQQMLQKIQERIVYAEEQGGLDEYGARLTHAINYVLGLKKKYDSISQMQADLKELLNMNFQMRSSDVSMERERNEKIRMELKDQIDTIGIEYNCLEIKKTNKFRLVFEPTLKFMPFSPIYLDFHKQCDGQLVHRQIDIGFKSSDKQISHGGIIGKPFNRENPIYLIKNETESNMIWVSLSNERKVQEGIRVIGPTVKSNDWYALYAVSSVSSNSTYISRQTDPQVIYDPMILVTQKQPIVYKVTYECYMIGVFKVLHVLQIGGKYKDVRYAMNKHCASDGPLFINVYSYYPWYVFFFRFRNPTYYSYQYGDVVQHEGVSVIQQKHVQLTHSRLFYLSSYSVNNYKPFYVNIKAKSKNITRCEAYVPAYIYYKPGRFVTFRLDTFCHDRGNVNIEMTLQVSGYANITFVQKRFCRQKDNYDFIVTYIFLTFLLILLTYHVANLAAQQLGLFRQYIRVEIINAIGEQEGDQRYERVGRGSKKAQRLVMKYNRRVIKRE